MKKILNDKLKNVKETFMKKLQLFNTHIEHMRQDSDLYKDWQKEGVYSKVSSEYFAEKIAFLENEKKKKNKELIQVDRATMKTIEFNRPKILW